MVYRSSDHSNMFTAGALKAVCQHDAINFRSQAIFNESCRFYDPSTAFCCPSWSLGHIVALIVGKNSCDDINENDVETTTMLLQKCVQYYDSGCLESDDTCHGVPANCTELGSVFTILNYLTPSTFANDLRSGNQPELEVTLVLTPLWWDGEDTLNFYETHIGKPALDGDALEIIAIGSGIKLDVFNRIFVEDAVYIGVSFVCVLLIMWVYVGSVFITVMTMVSMIMSMVVAFFLFHIVFRISFFPFLNIISVILVIGVGADDCFVYVDIWKATKKESSEAQHQLVSILCDTLKHASTTMFVTSLTTSSALFAGIVSTITALRCFAVFAGSAILVNFVLMLTWIPASVMIHEKYFLWEKAGESSSSCRRCWYTVEKIYDRIAGISRKFFEVYLPLTVNKFRFLWIFVLSGLGIGAFCVVFVRPMLRLPSQSDLQLYKSSNIFEQYDQVYKGMFSFENDSAKLMPAMIVWGVKPLDNGDNWDPEGIGTTVFDETFDIASPESQQWLYDLCSDFRNSSLHYNQVEPGGEYCFIEAFRSFMEDSSCNNPVIDVDLGHCCNQTAFPYSSTTFTECAIIFSDIRCQRQGCTSSLPGLRFNSNQNIVAMDIHLQTNIPFSQDYISMSRFWKDLNDWVEGRLISAPSGLKAGWFVSMAKSQMGFFDVQQSLATGATLSIGISIAIASSVLFITVRNVLLTLYAVFSIACAVFVVIASVVLIGWELNVFESIVLSLAVGLAVDFTIHLGVAYRHSTATDCETRSMYALRSLSAAITMAAFSTFMAGACMLPATVLSYLQLGIFLTLVMVISWFYGIFLFMSLCRTIGPKGMFAQISLSCCQREPRVTQGGEKEPTENRYQTEIVPQMDNQLALSVQDVESCHGETLVQPFVQSEELFGKQIPGKDNETGEVLNCTQTVLESSA